MRTIAPSEILAFLQNPWFPASTPESTVRRYRIDRKFRTEMLASTMTGARLVGAFNRTWFDNIYWDNSNPEHGLRPEIAMPPDIEYMRATARLVMPKLVITFGMIAQDGWKKVQTVDRELAELGFLHTHHPNARHRTGDQLAAFALLVKNCRVP